LITRTIYRRYHYPVWNSNCNMSYGFYLFRSNYHNNFYGATFCTCITFCMWLRSSFLWDICPVTGSLFLHASRPLRGVKTLVMNIGWWAQYPYRTKTSSAPVPTSGGLEVRTNYRGPTILGSFCLSRYYYANLGDNPLRPSPSHSATKGQSSDLLYRFLVAPALLEGPNPLSLTQSAPLRTPEKSHYTRCNISCWP
jgi:hypothetical protein